MTTVTMPATPNAQTMMWTLVQPAQVNVSGWTGGRQVLVSNRGWWECSYSLPPIVTTASFNPWRAFIAAMNGSANDVHVPVDPVAQSVIANTMLVNGASQTGRSLIVDGLPNSTTVLTAGQFVTVGDQLLQLTANVTTNGSGQATLSFAPPLRSAPADNAVVEFKNPYCLMYLADQASYSVEAGYVYSLAFQFRESF